MNEHRLWNAQVFVCSCEKRSGTKIFLRPKGWKNHVPTFFKARQEKGSLSPACEWFPEIEELVRSDWNRGNREMRVYAALRVSQLPIRN